MSKHQSKYEKQASSEAAWALIIEGVSAARLEVHRLKHLISRAMRLVEGSSEREHLFQVAGDLITAIPERITQTERFLDRTSLALSKMGEDFLSARLPIADKNLVEDTIEAAGAFSNGQRSPKSQVALRVAQRYLQAQDPAANVARTLFSSGFLPGGPRAQAPPVSVGLDESERKVREVTRTPYGGQCQFTLVFGGKGWEGGICAESPLFKDFLTYYPGRESTLGEAFLEKVRENLSTYEAHVEKALSPEKLLSLLGLADSVTAENIADLKVGKLVLLPSFVRLEEDHLWVPFGVSVSLDLVR